MLSPARVGRDAQADAPRARHRPAEARGRAPAARRPGAHLPHGVHRRAPGRDAGRLRRADRLRGSGRASSTPSSSSTPTRRTCTAHAMDAKVPALVATNRATQLMALQRKIARDKNRALVGREMDVLVDGPSEEHDFVMKGRHAGQAPEIDGSVYLSEGEARTGEMRRVKITQSSDWDLVGELLDDGITRKLRCQGPPRRPQGHRRPQRKALAVSCVTRADRRSRSAGGSPRSRLRR